LNYEYNGITGLDMLFRTYSYYVDEDYGFDPKKQKEEFNK